MATNNGFHFDGGCGGYVGKIEHIFIAPEKGAQVRPLPAVEAIAECGLKGDRYSRDLNRKNVGQQVTLIEAEAIEKFVAETGLAMAPHEPRRNLVTRGIDLNALLGKRFKVGECEFEGFELCEPCATWGRNTHMEVVRFFVHRGGLNARIVKGGTISVGCSITAHGRLEEARW
ncbi:MAG: MOSC domain-containing protein [Lysobacterales bacterium]